MSRRLERLGRVLVVLGTVAALEVLLVVLMAAWWLPPADGAPSRPAESRYSVRVDVVDQTDGTWPVEAVVRAWDRSSSRCLERSHARTTASTGHVPSVWSTTSTRTL